MFAQIDYSEMTMKDWLLIVMPFVGVIVGATITSIAKLIELRHQRRVDLDNRRADRLGDMYHSISQQIDELRDLGSKVLSIAIEQTAEHEFEIRKNALLDDFRRPALETMRGVALYCPSLIVEATLLSEAMSPMVDDITAFFERFSDRSERPTPQATELAYEQLSVPISEMSRALGDVQAGLGRELHKLLGLQVGEEFWNFEQPSED